MADMRIGITRDLAAVAMGQKPGDLIIRNGKLVNVLTASMEDNVDIIVHKGFIAFVGDASSHPTDGVEMIDAAGKYLVPGFIDSHMHVESSMVDLRSFVAGIVPHGTTTICPDIHEMTNVLGLKAVELFDQTAENLPIKVLTAMPVCVPSIPGMEDTGAAIGPEEVEQAYSKGWAKLQGEQMNFPGVIFGDEQVHAITEKGLQADMVMTGHYSSPEMAGGLNAFIASGMMACHESTSAEEVYQKASRGMYVQMRYGSAWLDLPKLVPAFLDHPEMDTRMFTIVSDDMSAETIVEEGHLTRAVRKAVDSGVSPMQAIQMVTINAAQLLKKDQWIGSLAPGKAADILVIGDWSTLTPELVISDGVLVAENGKLIEKIAPFDYPKWAVNSVHLQQVNAEDFQVQAPVDSSCSVRVIELLPGEVVTRQKVVTVTPVDGAICADPANDLTKVAMFYRHEQEVPAEHKMSFGFLNGVDFGENCAYASTVSHDCHNLLVLGTDDAAMALAANTLIEAGGGICVVKDGQVLAKIDLPFAGLMSLKSIEEAALELRNVQKAIRQLGCRHGSVEMTISLLGLIVLPELHISNKGLVELKDGQPPRFVELFV